MTDMKRLGVLGGVLLMLVAGGVATYWVRSRGVEAAPEASAVTVKPAGEPTRSPAVAPGPVGTVLHADIYFDFKSARLRADAVRVLQETAARMDRANPWVVLVQGYADRQGPAEYNRVLAQRRAEAAKRFLVELGVPETAIKLMTMGQDGALCEDPGQECQQLNRRVHLEIRQLAAGVPAPPVDATSAASDRSGG
jgi:outer membrane protein OmpA-like peptidoglycan-associated protein